jgi:hypothetical protein
MRSFNHSVMQQLVAGVEDYVGNPVHPFLGKGPVSGFEAILDSWEYGCVVTRPQLGSINDMFELRAVWYLLNLLACVH